MVTQEVLVTRAYIYIDLSNHCTIYENFRGRQLSRILESFLWQIFTYHVPQA